MEKIKLTKKDIDRIIPPKNKKDAIEESERFEQEYEKNKKDLEEILEALKKLAEEFNKNERNEDSDE